MQTKPRKRIDLVKTEELASRGLTRAEIAAALHISERTLYSRQKDNADFAASINAGFAQGKATVINVLFEIMTAEAETEAQAERNGGYKFPASLRLRAAMFYLERRAGWNSKAEFESAEDQSGNNGTPSSILVQFVEAYQDKNGNIHQRGKPRRIEELTGEEKLKYGKAAFREESNGAKLVPVEKC